MKKTIRIFSVVLALSILVSLFATAFSVSAIYEEHLYDPASLRQSYVSRYSGAPKIFDITTGTNKVACYDLYEIEFKLNAEYTNPFDPDDIQVDGVFTYPSGKVVTIPAFYIEPMKKTDGKVLLTYNPKQYTKTGDPGWRIRFAGDEVGKYSFKIVARDSKGRTCESNSNTFDMYRGRNKGWAKISDTNPSVVVNSADNSVYYGSGSNIAWVRSQFTKDPGHLSYNYFVNQAKDNTNMTRVWICHWAWLEWSTKPDSANSYSYAGLGYYNQAISSSFDDVVALCEDAGLRMVVVTEDNDEVGVDDDYDGWKYNPYSTYQGGFAENQAEYFKSPEVREQYKKRLRYIIARWGYSSAIYSINMWNDMSAPSDDIISYLKELRDYTHTLTDGWRPFLYGSNYSMGANSVLDYTSQSIRSFDGTKPSVTNECFSSNDTAYFRDSLRGSIWKELCDGSAGTMIWSHDDVDVNNCWDLFNNVLDFTADIPYASYKFKSGETSVSSATPTNTNIALKKVVSVRPYGDVSNWGVKSPENLFEIDTSASGMLLQGYVSKLYGSKSNVSKWKNPPTFVINAPNGGEMILQINEFGGGTNNLTVNINGTKVTEVVYTGGRRYTTEDEKYVTVPLVKGENRIKLDNAGQDWINIHTTYFILNATSAAEMVTAHTHIADEAAVVYLENQTYSEITKSILKKDPSDFTNVSFTVSGLKDGKYALYGFNPDTGEYSIKKEVTVSGGKTEITIPQVAKDYAIKLLKLNGNKKVGEGSRYTSLQLTTYERYNPNGANNTVGIYSPDKEWVSSDDTNSSDTESDSTVDTGASDKDSDSSINTDSSAKHPNKTQKGSRVNWLVLGIVIGLSLIAAAGITVAIIVIIKKRKAKSVDTENTSVEESEDTSIEENEDN